MSGSQDDARNGVGETADPRFREIARERVSERVAQEIMKLISVGALAPGERLPGERQLAEMMNVSRVSVRAALQQLKAQGFVAAVQGGGTRVTSAAAHRDSPLMQLVRADAGNLHDLAEIRAQVEAWAARRAAERGSESQIAEIGRALAMMADKGRANGHKSEDDYAFHLAIAKASCSGVYMHLMEMMGEVLERNIDYHRHTLCTAPDDDARFLEEHRRIYEAIRRRDPGAAEAAMAAHLQHVLAGYAKVESTPAALQSQETNEAASTG